MIFAKVTELFLAQVTSVSFAEVTGVFHAKITGVIFAQVTGVILVKKQVFSLAVDLVLFTFHLAVFYEKVQEK